MGKVMTYENIKFEPFSDTGANELEKIDNHNIYIKNGQYEDAATLALGAGKGFTASFYNAIQNKVRNFGDVFLNDFSANQCEYITRKDPDEVDLPSGYEVLVQIL